MSCMPNRLIKTMVLVFSLLIAFPPHYLIAAIGQSVTAPGENHQKIFTHYQSNHLVVLVPDVFNRQKDRIRAIMQLQQRGIAPDHIVDLSTYSSFDPAASLRHQSEQLAQFVEMESAKRFGAKAHLIAIGTGGLVARDYLQQAKILRPGGVPVHDVIGIGVPHKGRQWAEWAYRLHLPLPTVGIRSQAIRDLSPQSAFMQNLNNRGKKHGALEKGTDKLLHAMINPEFNQVLRKKMAAIEQEKAIVGEQVDLLIHFPKRIKLDKLQSKQLKRLDQSQRKMKKLFRQSKDEMGEWQRPDKLKILSKIVKQEASDLKQQVKTTISQVQSWEQSRPSVKQLHKFKTIRRHTLTMEQSVNVVLQNKLNQLIDLEMTFAQNQNKGVQEKRLLTVLHQVQDQGDRSFSKKTLHNLNQSIHQLDQPLSQALKTSWTQRIATNVNQTYGDQATRLMAAAQSFAMQVRGNLKLAKIKPTVSLNRDLRKLEKMNLARELNKLNIMQKQFAAVAALQESWENLDQKKSGWLNQSKALADAKAGQVLSGDIRNYIQQLEQGAQKLHASKDEQITTIESELRVARKDVVDDVLQAFATNNPDYLKKQLVQSYRQLKEARLEFMNKVAEAKAVVSEKIIRPESLAYVEQLKDMENIVMLAVDQNHQTLYQAAMANKMGGAAKEMALFAKASRHRLDREQVRLFRKMENLPLMQKLEEVEQLKAGIDQKLDKLGIPANDDWKNISFDQHLSAQNIRNHVDQLQQGFRTKHLLDSLNQLKKDAAQWQQYVMQNQAALKQTQLVAQLSQTIQGLSQTEKKLKWIFKQQGKAMDWKELANSRRRSVTGLQSVGDAALEQLKSIDVMQVAARTQALGELLGHPEGMLPVLRQTLQDLDSQVKTLQKQSEPIWQQARQSMATYQQARQVFGVYQSLQKQTMVKEVAVEQMRQQVEQALDHNINQKLVTHTRSMEQALKALQTKSQLLGQVLSRQSRMNLIGQKADQYMNQLQTIKTSDVSLPEDYNNILHQLTDAANQMKSEVEQQEWSHYVQAAQGGLGKECNQLLQDQKAMKALLKQAGQVTGLPLDSDKLIAQAERVRKQYTLALKAGAQNHLVSLTQGALYQSLNRTLSLVSQFKYELINNITKNEQQLMQHPALGALKQAQDLQEQLQHQVNNVSTSWLDGQTRSTLNQLGLDTSNLDNTLNDVMGTLKQSLGASTLRHHLNQIESHKNLLSQTVQAQVGLMEEKMQVAQLMDRFNNLIDAQAKMDQFINQADGELQKVLSTEGVLNHLKNLSLDNKQLAQAVGMVGQEIQAAIQSQGLRFNPGQLQAIAQQVEHYIGGSITSINLDPIWINQLGDLSQLTTNLGQTFSDLSMQLDLSATMSSLSTELGRAGDTIGQAFQSLASGQALSFDWVRDQVQSITDLDRMYQFAMNQAGDFIRLQAARYEVQLGLGRISGLGTEAQGLMAHYITAIHQQAANAGLVQQMEGWGLGNTAFMALDRMALQFSMGATQSRLMQNLNGLTNLQVQFNNSMEREVLLIQKADATVLMHTLNERYQQMGNQFQQAWEQLAYSIDPTNWSLDPALNIGSLFSFQMDQQLFNQLRQDVFARLVASNPALRELERLNDLTGSLNRLLTLGGNQLRGVMEQSGLYEQINQLEVLRNQAQSIVEGAIDQGAADLIEGQLGNLLHSWGLQSRQIDHLMKGLSGPLKDMFVQSGLWDQLTIFNNIPDLINEHIDNLVGDAQALVGANQMVQAIDALGKDAADLMDQLSGKKPLDLMFWGKKMSQHFSDVTEIGSKLMTQIIDFIQDLSIPDSISGAWTALQDAMTTIAASVLEAGKNVIAAACHLDLGAIVINITSAAKDLFGRCGDRVGNLFSGAFEFQIGDGLDWFGLPDLWDTITNVITSDLFQFDFFLGLDGLMHAFTEMTTDMWNKGIQWIGDRWAQVEEDFGYYRDIILGGPESWWKELQKPDVMNSISNFVDQYLPPHYQPAKSALMKIGKMFDEEFNFSMDYLMNILGDMSAYFTGNFRDYYDAFKDYYKQSKEYYAIVKEAWQAIQSGDVLRAVAGLGRAIGGLELLYGDVYIRGAAYHADSGQINEAWIDQLQDDMADRLGLTPAQRDKLQSQIEDYQNNQNQHDYEEGQDLANYAGMPPVNVGARHVLPKEDNPLSPDLDLERLDLGPPRMSGVPHPPGPGQWAKDPKTGMMVWVRAGPDEDTTTTTTSARTFEDNSVGTGHAQSEENTDNTEATDAVSDEEGALVGDGYAHPDSLLDKAKAFTKNSYNTEASLHDGFGKGAVEGYLSESDSNNAYLPTHRWANKKTEEARLEAAEAYAVLDAQEAELDATSKGFKKWFGKAKLKGKKAKVIARSIVKESLYDIPKLGQDLPDAWSATQQVKQDIKDKNFRKAARSAGKALGVVGKEASRVTGIGGVIGKSAKGFKAGIGIAKAAKKVGKSAGKTVGKAIRKKTSTAQSFYKKAGFSKEAASSHMEGIDFTKPVKVKTVKKGTIVIQYVRENGEVGKYFAPPGTPMNKLGIKTKGRVMKKFVATKDIEVLESTAGDYKKYKGGGQQYFIPDNKAFKEVR